MPPTGNAEEEEERGSQENPQVEAAAQETEEARAVKMSKNIYVPTAAEVEEHNRTHLPYRCWCEHCVKGRRDNPPHRARDEVPAGPEVGLDYCFVRRRGEGDCLTILLMKLRRTRAIRAWALKNKGVCTDEPTRLAVDGLRDMGLGGEIVYFKVDNERPLVALRDAVIAGSSMSILPLEVPVRDSASNGMTENGVKVFKGLLRVHLLSLERRIGGKIPSSHPILTWLVQHTANILTKCLVGTDGKTAYERLLKRKLHEEGL